MRTRIASAVVVLLALGFSTITLARPRGDEPPKPQEQVSPRMQLRARVASLRAEIELLQLEHDADVATLKEMIKDIWELRRQERMGRLRDEILKKVGDPLSVTDRKTADQETLKHLSQLLDDARAPFLERTTALNEKKLELVDLEQRLSIAR